MLRLDTSESPEAVAAEVRSERTERASFATSTTFPARVRSLVPEIIDTPDEREEPERLTDDQDMEELVAEAEAEAEVLAVL